LEDDFFEIGGNSLVAASVFHGISVEFKQNIDLALLFRVKNLQQLAAKIDETIQNGGTAYSFSNLIKLQDSDESNNDDRKYFFFHALGGNTLNYRVFLKHLKGHDVYGLQATGVDGKNIAFITIDDMAENYVRDIIKECPDGPYNLVGGSLGGLLAYICAKKLKERGKDVGTIAMFDTSIPLPKKNKIDAESRKEVKKTLRAKLFGSFRFRFFMLINRIFNIFNRVTPHSIRYTLIEQLNLKALRQHKPLHYKGDIFLIRIPMQKKGLYSHRGLGWENYLDGNIEVDYIDASHHHFIEDEKVIESFGKWIDRKNKS
jgi:pimeloyl-ACP methyl ester carboxylesterase